MRHYAKYQSEAVMCAPPHEAELMKIAWPAFHACSNKTMDGIGISVLAGIEVAAMISDPPEVVPMETLTVTPAVSSNVIEAIIALAGTVPILLFAVMAANSFPSVPDEVPLDAEVSRPSAPTVMLALV
jgi:hypothetical protein